MKYFNKSDIYKLLTVLAKRDNGIVFYAVKNVDELNTYCASGGKKAYKLPTGAEVTQVACTSGDEVFLVEPIFKKMDILQQAILRRKKDGSDQWQWATDVYPQLAASESPAGGSSSGFPNVEVGSGPGATAH